MIKDRDYIIVPFAEEHKSYLWCNILETYKKSGESWRTLWKLGIYYTVSQYIWKKVLPACSIRVAVAPEDQNSIMGLSIFTNDLLYLVSVKPVYFGQGIGTELLKETPDVPQTISTKAGRALLEKNGRKLNADDWPLISIARDLFRKPDGDQGTKE